MCSLPESFVHSRWYRKPLVQDYSESLCVCLCVCVYVCLCVCADMSLTSLNSVYSYGYLLIPALLVFLSWQHRSFVLNFFSALFTKLRRRRGSVPIAGIIP